MNKEKLKYLKNVEKISEEKIKKFTFKSFVF